MRFLDAGQDVVEETWQALIGTPTLLVARAAGLKPSSTCARHRRGYTSPVHPRQPVPRPPDLQAVRARRLRRSLSVSGRRDGRLIMSGGADLDFVDWQFALRIRAGYPVANGEWHPPRIKQTCYRAGELRRSERPRPFRTMSPMPAPGCRCGSADPIQAMPDLRHG